MGTPHWIGLQIQCSVPWFLNVWTMAHWRATALYYWNWIRFAKRIFNPGFLNVGCFWANRLSLLHRIDRSARCVIKWFQLFLFLLCTWATSVVALEKLYSWWATDPLFNNLATCLKRLRTPVLYKSIASKNIQSDMNSVSKILNCVGHFGL